MNVPAVVSTTTTATVPGTATVASQIRVASTFRSKKGRIFFLSKIYVFGRPSLLPLSDFCTNFSSPPSKLSIPYEYRWQDLKDLFRREVGDVSFVELFNDETNKPRGCGIVEFEKVESVAVALDKMNRYDLNGRNLVVKEDYGNERDKYGRVIPKNVGGGGGGGGSSYRSRDRDDDRM